MSNLNENFDTFITAEKNFLSGGFQQRVAFARALYKKPRLLLIDEGTSQLDPEADKYFCTLISNLAKKEITVILITHRLKTLEIVDRTLILDGGKIIDSLSSKNNEKVFSFFEGN